MTHDDYLAAHARAAERDQECFRLEAEITRLSSELAASRERERALERERDDAVGKREVWHRYCVRVLKVHRERTKAAEAEVKRLTDGLTAAIRAAELALFVIRKQGVMPNSSWQSGFDKDMATAKAALADANTQGGSENG